MRKLADGIYYLDLQKPSIPLACPRCGKGYIAIQWLPGGQYGIAHTCPGGVKPMKKRFDNKKQAAYAWNRYCKGGDLDEGCGAGTGVESTRRNEQAGISITPDPTGSRQD